MATLAPSLTALFNEIDASWPNRDHRTDGWIGDKNHCPGVSDHCADSAGRVHAIDIDKDGINPAFVIERLSKYPTVIHYINFDRKKYHGPLFKPTTLGGSNPHTGHIHVSIFRNGIARSYNQGYGIYAPTAPPPVIVPIPQLPAQTDWDHSAHVFFMSGQFAGTGDVLTDYSNAIANVRR